MTEEEIRFRIPESRVLSVRLNQEEENVLSDAAQRRGVKLSTYIKNAALDDASHPEVIWWIRLHGRAAEEAG